MTETTAELEELEKATEHLNKAFEITSCGYCKRDLTIALLLIENIKQVLRDIGKKEKEEKKQA